MKYKSVKFLLQALAFVTNKLPKTDWKPIPLCDVYAKYDLNAPNLVGHVTAPSVSTGSASSVGANSFIMGGTIDSNGGENASVRGFVYSNINASPTTSDSVTNASGSFGAGAYSMTLSGLTQNTLYYVRAYATNSGGTGYGSTVQVTTANLGPPSMGTDATTSITTTTATANGTIYGINGAAVTERGFVWSTSSDPTVSSNAGKITQTGSYSTGSFSGSMTGLSPSTLYYVRSYGINSYGTAYGANSTFSTASVPTVKTVGQYKSDFSTIVNPSWYTGTSGVSENLYLQAEMSNGGNPETSTVTAKAEIEQVGTPFDNVANATTKSRTYKNDTIQYAKRGGALVYDSHNKRYLFFGGFDGTSRYNQVWEKYMDVPGQPWNLLSASGTAPVGRNLHAATYVKGTLTSGGATRAYMIVWGGSDGTNDLGDMWALRVDTPGSEAWTQITQTGAPTARSYVNKHLVTTPGTDASNNYLYLFGGWAATRENQLVRATFDVDTPTAVTWTTLKANGAAGNPTGRSGALLDYKASTGQLLLYGGYSGTMLSDFWIYTIATNTWQQRTVSGTAFTGSEALAGGYDSINNRFWVTGGWTTNGTFSTSRNNIGYISNVGGSEAYVEVRANSTTNQSYPGHSFAANTVDPDKGWLVLFQEATVDSTERYDYIIDFRDTATSDFPVYSMADGEFKNSRDAMSSALNTDYNEWVQTGGFEDMYDNATIPNGSHSGDVWSYDTTLNRWRYAVKGFKALPQIEGSYSCYDTTRDRIIVFGSLTGATQNGNDVWSLTRDANGNYEVKQLRPTGTRPSPRWLGFAVFDEANNRAIFGLGGDNSGPTNNVWALNFSGSADGAWTQLSPTGTVTGVIGPAFGVAKNAKRVYIFGGATNGGLTTISSQTAYFDYSTTNGAWTTISTTNSIGRRTPAADFDEANNTFIVYGGFNGSDVVATTSLLRLSAGSAWEHTFPITYPAARRSTIGQLINGKFYIDSGRPSTGTWFQDTWEYTPDYTSVGNGTWIERKPNIYMPVYFTFTGGTSGNQYHWQAWSTEGTTDSAKVSFGSNAETSPDFILGNAPPAVAPTVTSSAATNVTAVAATANGAVTDLGYEYPSERGIVFSLSSSADPTVSTNLGKVVVAGDLGSFTAALTGLSPSTSYKYRAYATNSAGTGYSSVQTFTTSAYNPKTFTLAATMSISGGGTGYVALYNRTKGVALAEASTTSSTPTLVTKDYEVGDTNFSDQDEYEIRVRTNGTGTVNLYSAKLFIRLMDLTKITTWNRISRFGSAALTAASAVTSQRFLYTAGNYSNPELFWEITGQEDIAGTNDFGIYDVNTTDIGTSGAVIAETRVDVNSATKTRQRVNRISLTDGDRYIGIFNRSSGGARYQSGMIGITASGAKGTVENQTIIELADISRSSQSTGTFTPLIFRTPFNPLDVDNATFYFEVIGRNANTTIAYDVQLLAVNASGTETVAGTVSLLANTGSSNTRRRSGTITIPSDTVQLRVRLPQTAAAQNVFVEGARLIIVQTNANRALAYIPLGGSANDANDETTWPMSAITASTYTTPAATEDQWTIWKRDDSMYDRYVGIGKSPTVALNTADAATLSATPTLEFTGTDPEGQDVSYQVQISNLNTMDEFLDSSNLITGNVGGVTGDLTAIDRGQSFTTTSAGDMYSLVVNISKFGTPTDGIQAKIYTNNAGAPGTLLGTSSNTLGLSSFPTSSIAGNFNEAKFYFDSGITLSAGTRYWFVIDRTGAASNTNYYSIEGSSSIDYGSEDGMIWNGTSWAATGVLSLVFKAYLRPTQSITIAGATPIVTTGQTGSLATNASGTTNQSLTIPTLTNGMLLLPIFEPGGVTSLTYNGQALTLAATTGNWGWYYLLSPPSGTNTLTIVRSSTTTARAVTAYYLSNVDQAAPIGISDHGTASDGTTVTRSLNIPTHNSSVFSLVMYADSPFPSGLATVPYGGAVETTYNATQSPGTMAVMHNVPSGAGSYGLTASSGSFASVTISSISINAAVPFTNTVSGVDANPFTSGQKVSYTSPTLADGTYYWRVRAKDPAGSNTWGEWSTARSFTVAGVASYTRSHGTSAVKGARFIKTHTTSANKKTANLTRSHTTDAYKTKTFFRSHSTDSLKRKQSIVSHTTSANKKKQVTLSHTTNALKRTSPPIWHNTDALKKVRSLLTHSTSSVKRKQTTVSHTTSSNLKKSGITRTHLTDANKKKANNLLVHSTSAIKRKAFSVQHSTDANKKVVGNTVSHTTSSSLNHQFTLSHSTDARLALGVQTIDIAHSTDSLKRKQALLSHTTSAMKRQQLVKTHTTSALKRKQFTKTHTTSSVKRKQFTKTHTTDALKRQQLTLSHTTSANKRTANLTLSHTTDANKKASGSVSHSTDSFKRKIYTLAHSTDANRKKANNTVSHTTSANKKVANNLRSHTTDSLKRLRATLSHTTDSNKKKTGTLSHTTGAYIQNPPFTSTVVDNFNDNTVNTALWATSNGSGSSSETNQRVQLTLNSGAASPFEGAYFQTNYSRYFNFVGQEFKWQIVQGPNNSQKKGYGWVTIGTTRAVSWTLLGTTLQAVYNTGPDNVLYSVAFSSAVSWVRIRESGGTIYFDTSADGVAWTNRASQVPAGTITLDKVTAGFGLEPTTTTTSVGTYYIDNVNIGGQFTRSYTTDSLKRKATVLTHSTSANLKKANNTLSHTTSALKKKSGNVLTHTTDALKLTRNVLSHTTSANKKKAYTVSHTTSANKRVAAITRSHTTSSVLRKQSTLSHSTDALKRSQATKSHLTDTLKRRANTVSHTTSSFKRTQNVLSHSTDAIKRLATTKYHTTDAYLAPPLFSIGNYYFDGSDGISDPNGYWGITDADTFDASYTTGANSATSSSTTFGYLYGQGTNAPSTNTASITQVRVRMYAQGDQDNYAHFADWTTLTEPTGGWSWLKVSNLETKITMNPGGGKGATSAAAYIYSDGLAQELGVNYWGATGGSSIGVYVWRIDLEVTYSNVVPQTRLHNTDALKRKANITVTHTTDTVKRVANTKAHQTDSFKRVRNTLSHTTDTLKKVRRTLSHTTSSFLRRQLAISHSTNALKRKATVVSHTTSANLKKANNAVFHKTDANKRRAYTIAHTTDANKKKSNNVLSHLTDALKRTVSTKSHTTDAFKKVRISLSHTTDSFLRRRSALAHSTDSFLRKINVLAHTTDANKKRVNNVLTHTTSANKKRANNVISHTTSALKRKQFTLSHSTSAVLRRQLSISHSTSANKRKLFSLTHTTDANLRKATLASHTTDANKKRAGITLSHTTSANKRKANLVLTHTTDALKRTVSTLSHSTSSFLRRRSTLSHLTDAFLRGASALTHTTDSVLRRQTTKVHTTDANKRKANNLVSHSTSANKKRSYSVSHSTDANKRKLTTVSHSTNSLLRKIFTVSHTTSSNKKKANNVLAHTTSALKRTRNTLSHTTNALKRVRPVLTHTTDSFLRRRISLSHTTSAFLRKINVLSHTTDSNKRKANNVLSHTTDANKRKVTSVFHTTDALKRTENILSHLTDAFLRAQTALSHTTDSLLRKANGVNHRTDSYLRGANGIFHSTDANKRVAGNTVSHSTSANKRKDNNLISHSTDTLKRTQNVLSHSTDTLKRTITQLSHTTDSFLRKIVALTHTTDAFKRTRNILSHTTDALIRKSNTVGHSTDSNRKRSGNVVSHTTSANKRKLFSLTHLTDANKRKSNNLLTHTTDANRRKSGNLVTHTTSAVLRRIASASHQTDALKRSLNVLSHSTSSFLRKSHTLSHSTDSNLKKTAAKFHLTDAFKRNADDLFHTTSANMRKADGVSHTTDTLKRIIRSVSHTTNSFLRVRKAVSHTTDAFLRIITSVDHTTDANKRKPIEISHSTSAALRGGNERSHTTSANLRKAQVVSHSTDANKRKPAEVDHTTDTYLRARKTLSHTTDAFLRKPSTVAHSTSANKRKANVVAHSTSSNLKKPNAVQHATDAELKQRWTADHSTDAFIRKAVAVNHKTDANKKRGQVVSHATSAVIGDKVGIAHTTDAYLFAQRGNKKLLVNGVWVYGVVKIKVNGVWIVKPIYVLKDGNWVLARQ